MYNLTALNPGNGYVSSFETWWLNITPVASQVDLLLNGSSANFSIGQYEFVNMTGLQVAGDDSAVIELYLDGSLINSGASSVENITQFNDSGIYNVTLVYPGTQNYTSVSETWWVKVNDTTEPTPADPTEYPTDSATYAPGQSYQFNVTWTDNVGVQDVLIEHNFTGSFQNYTVSGNQGDVYYYDYVGLNHGVYAWRMIANDSAGNHNVTDQYSYTVVQAGSFTYLYLNGSRANLSTVFDGGFNVTGVTGALNVSLYRDGVLVNESSGLVGYYYELLGVGLYNLTALNPGNGYESSSETWWLNITQAASEVNLTLNGVDDDLIVGAGAYVNITARMANPSSGYVELYMNGTLINSGADAVSNYTQFMTVTIYNFTAVYPATQNYSGSYETHILTISPDITKPVVRDASAEPDPIDQGQSTNITANITDNLGFGTVYAEVYFPNGTAINYTMENAVGDIWNYTFYTDSTYPGGLYNVRIIAIDSADNVNATETTSFTVNDITNPVVKDINPPEAEPFNQTAVINITANVTDETNVSTVLANITWDATSQLLVMQDLDGDGQYNATFTDTIMIGTYNITIIANDTSNNVNDTETSYFIVSDVTDPIIENISYDPNTQAGLDPGVFLNITADVFDLLLDTVILQYRLENETEWINTTMTGIGGNAFQGGFILTEANWTFRIFANDTSGNTNISYETNITVISEETWERTPADLGIIATNSSQTVVLGNITITNEADIPFSYDITTINPLRTWVYFSNSSFTLDGSSSKEIEVTATAPAAEANYSINIFINETSGNSPISNLTTTAELRVTQVFEPVLEVSIVIYDATAEQGDTGTLLAVKVENTGTGSATNTLLNWSLPLDWTVSNGSLNKSISSLGIGEIFWNNISVDVPATAQIGTFNITAYSECDENKNDSDSKVVTVASPPVVPPAEEVVRRRGGGGGAGGTTIVAPEERDTFLVSTRTIHIARGESKSIPFEVSNIFEDTVLMGLTIDVDGFMSQYVDIEPSRIDRINYGETKTFTVTIKAPSYIDIGDYPLNFTVKGKVGVGTYIKQFVDMTYATLVVHNITEEEINFSLEEAELAIEEMEDMGFMTDDQKNELDKAKEALEDKDYELAKELSDRIIAAKKTAFKAHALIEEVKNMIVDAEARGIDATQSKRALNLAILAFERGDYDTALKRAKEAQLTYMLEIKGKLNIIWIVQHYWWLLLLLLLLLYVSLRFMYLRFLLLTVDRRMRDLDEEERTILALMQEAQRKCFVEKTLSRMNYFKIMAMYEKRLVKIKQIKANLRARRAGIIRIENELKNLENEAKEIVGLMKKVQVDYFNKGIVSRRRYKSDFKSYKKRLAEIEKAKAMLETKLRIEGKKRTYQVKQYVGELNNSLYEIIREFMKGRRKKPKPAAHDIASRREMTHMLEREITRVRRNIKRQDAATKTSSIKEMFKGVHYRISEALNKRKKKHEVRKNKEHMVNSLRKLMQKEEKVVIKKLHLGIKPMKRALGKKGDEYFGGIDLVDIKETSRETRKEPEKIKRSMVNRIKGIYGDEKHDKKRQNKSKGQNQR
ncbi:NEW3 domain-containing protein [Thermoproteota archaeon]